MAKRRSASKRGSKSSRPSKSTEVEVVEEAGGAGWEDGVAVVTAIVLALACFLTFGLG